MRPLIATILSAAMLAAAPAAVASDKPTGEEKLAKMLDGRVAGEPRDCITLSSVTSSQVVDKTAIVYRIGSTLWVHRPENGAESLDDNDHIPVHKLLSPRLCSIDTVQSPARAYHLYTSFLPPGKFL